MKKMMMIFTLVLICNSYVSFAKNVHFLECVTNDSYSKNVGVLPAGMDQYTYGKVTTTKVEGKHDIYYQTYCIDPGSINCRTTMSITNNDLPLDDNGIPIYDAEYLANRVDFIESEVTEMIDSDEPNTGNQSFNELYNGHYIYQNASWTVNEDSSFRITITIGVLE